MNIQNRTIFEGDNLPILRGMETESVDLIYLDPPFNSKKNDAVPIGNDINGTDFKYNWTPNDFKEEWYNDVADHSLPLYRAIECSEHTHSSSMKAYLAMMAVRLIEMKRVLRPTGSIYLHCNQNSSHYLKMVMDSIFGVDNFMNEIVWYYTSGFRSKRFFSRKHDIILLYTSKKNNHCFNVDTKSRIIDRINKKYFPNEKNDYVNDVWNISMLNSMSRERTGYPTQKPLALLEHIVKTSSNEGHLVLDPFCGSATACVAAEKLGRQWIGIDISPKAAEIVMLRLKEVLGMFGEVIHRTDVPVSDVNVSLPINRQAIKSQLYESQRTTCVGCLEIFPLRNLTIDHIVPCSQGGLNNIENLQLLCQACNSTKNNGTMENLAKRNLENGVITQSQYRFILDNTGNRLNALTAARIFVTHYENLKITGFENVSEDDLHDLVKKYIESVKIIQDAETQDDS